MNSLIRLKTAHKHTQAHPGAQLGSFEWTTPGSSSLHFQSFLLARPVWILVHGHGLFFVRGRQENVVVGTGDVFNVRLRNVFSCRRHDLHLLHQRVLQRGRCVDVPGVRRRPFQLLGRLARLRFLQWRKIFQRGLQFVFLVCCGHVLWF